MEFVIGGLIAIIVIIIVGLIIRKKMYDQVDYYEDWKLDIMNRNVAGELGRVKALQLEGDTKDRFEHWKNEWDTILGEDMADVEELLYDTEKAADRYNFPGAKKYIQAAHSCEADIDDIKEKHKTYELLVEQGNYADGESLIKRLKNKTAKREVEIEEFAEVYKKCKIEMPRRFDELSKGSTEMKEA